MYGLYENGKRCYVYAHRLVAKHFLNEVEGKLQVNHIDENKQNNNFNNLEWCTAKENTNHGTRNKRVSRKLSKEVAQYTMQGELLNIFCSANEAERQTGAYHQHISKCCKGKLKTTGGFIWKYANS